MPREKKAELTENTKAIIDVLRHTRNRSSKMCIPPYSNQLHYFNALEAKDIREGIPKTRIGWFVARIRFNNAKGGGVVNRE